LSWSRIQSDLSQIFEPKNIVVFLSVETNSLSSSQAFRLPIYHRTIFILEISRFPSERNFVGSSWVENKGVSQWEKFPKTSYLVSCISFLECFSTPDLDSADQHLIGGMQQLHFRKPPPPYPINRPSSNSTPDLASQALCAPRPHLFSPQVTCFLCAYSFIQSFSGFSLSKERRRITNASKTEVPTYQKQRSVGN